MRSGPHWSEYPPDDPPQLEPEDDDRCPVCGHVGCQCPPEDATHDYWCRCENCKREWEQSKPVTGETAAKLLAIGLESDTTTFCDVCKMNVLNTRIEHHRTWCNPRLGLETNVEKFDREIGLDQESAASWRKRWEAEQADRASMYPADWPKCPACGSPALDGHITCGNAACDEGAHRRAQ